MRSFDHVAQRAPHPDIHAFIGGVWFRFAGRGAAGTSGPWRAARNGGAAFRRSTYGRAANGGSPFRGTAYGRTRAAFFCAAYGRSTPLRRATRLTAFRGTAYLGAAARLRARRSALCPRRSALRRAAHRAASCVRACAGRTWRTAFGTDGIGPIAAHRRGTCRPAVQPACAFQSAVIAARRRRREARCGRDQGCTTASRPWHGSDPWIHRTAECRPRSDTRPDSRTRPSCTGPSAPRASPSVADHTRSGIRQSGYRADDRERNPIDLPRQLHAIHLGGGLASSPSSQLLRGAGICRPGVLALCL